MINPITKKDFCNIIYELKKNENFLDAINDVCRKFKKDTEIYTTGLEGVVVNLLESIFDDKESQWISWWIWELNFGELYKEGIITEVNNASISLRTAEELYDFLIKNIKENKKRKIL